MSELLFRVALVSAAVSIVLLPLLLATRWQRRYAPHTRRAVWLVIMAVLLIAPLLPKSQAPVQIEVPSRTVMIPAAPAVSRQSTALMGPDLTGQSGQNVELEEQAEPEVPAVRALEWGVVLNALWLFGAAAVLIWNGTRYLLARRKLLKRAVALTGYEELAKELCPGRTVRFFRVNGLDTPMSLGVLRPVVLLLDGNVCQAAVRHELTHIRRWDVAWKCLLLLACAVHWFNPLVWVMSRRADCDIEASCDAAVMAGGDAAELRAYGELLLRTAARQGIPFTTQFSGGKKLMKARLYDLFHPGKKSWVLVGMVLVLCLLAGSLVAFRSSDPVTASEAIQALEESVTCENGRLSFTIPANYSPGKDWNIHIAGRAEADGLGGISLHYLDSEQWEAGKTYTLDITENQWADITELSMDVTLGEESRSIDLLALVDPVLADQNVDKDWAEYEQHQVILPSSMLEKDDYNAEIFEIDPFAVNLYLPAGWTIQEAAGMRREGKETYPTVDGLFSVQCILDETGRPVGSLGYNLAPTYEEPTDDPMALFAGITMAQHSFDCRETFVLVTEDDGLIVAMADVVQNYPANEGREETRNRGILLRDEEIGVYVAIEIESGALTEEQAFGIAMRLSLSAVAGVTSTGLNGQAADPVPVFPETNGEPGYERLETDDLNGVTDSISAPGQQPGDGLLFVDEQAGMTEGANVTDNINAPEEFPDDGLLFMDEQAGTAEGTYWSGAFAAVEGNGTTIRVTYQNHEWDAVTVRLFQCGPDGTQTEVLQFDVNGYENSRPQEYSASGADAATYSVRVTCHSGGLIGGTLEVVQF